MPRLSKIGAAALAAFGWTGLQAVDASYLVVAGGGGGGGQYYAGGGGAGGYLTGTTSLNPTQSYTVTVGAGGASVSNRGSSGTNSQFGTLTASVGGGGGGANSISGQQNGATGGSGGGGSSFGASTTGTGGSGTSGQGNAGGTGNVGSGSNVQAAGGGGGGASAVGANASVAVGGNGGAGTASSISGSSVTYAGGGGGGVESGTAGTGGSGGGGNGQLGTGTAAAAGTANRGGGGGGSGYNASGGQGGSGVVIISYVGAQQFGGGIVTSSGGSTIHTFQTSGTLSPLSSLSASYLIVAGGGGGGAYAYPGGGGAGGFLSGSGLILDTNSIYIVSVGGGGVKGDVSGDTNGGNGVNSSFSGFATTAVGGGGGSQSTTSGGSGGSGGGGKGSTSGNVGGTATSGQGNNGGTGGSDGATWANGGGGGGAGAVGGTATSGAGGNGGAGLTSSISGTSTYYAGGGGGGGTGTEGTGGLGGGGAANESGGTAGTANTGGGGGSAGGVSVTSGGAGGSGIVIISYAGATQLMAGGTVTVSGGNVIHTFTSSGFLTPIVLTTNSLRFRSSASAYLNRTPPVASNRKTWTWSGWVKRGALTTASGIMSAGTSANDWTGFRFNSDDTFAFYRVGPGGGTTTYLNTTQVFRDPSSWYHIVLQWDTTQATSSNRIKLYINGVQVTAFASSSYPTLNYEDAFMNTAIAHLIGNITAVSQYLDGYLAEVNFIDGQALTPNSFGYYSDLGVWQPIRYGGSYGTNGFYLPFTNTTSTTTLGYDFSPNGNNWTTNNISLTAGSTYDSMTDVPTLTSATVANYSTLNPTLPIPAGTISQGSLNYLRGSTANHGSAGATFTLPITGKWYWEVTACANSGGSGNNETIGVANILNNPQLPAISSEIGGGSRGDYGYRSDGNKYNNGNQGAYGATYTNSDVIGVAWDSDAGTLVFYKNGSSQGTAFSSIAQVANKFVPASSNAESSNGDSYNFGQRPFSYTPPTGFVRLNTFNLPTPTIGATAATQAGKYFNPVIWTGTGGTRSITGVGFQPDFVWAKARSQAYSNIVFDSNRGVGKSLLTDTTGAEATNEANGYISSFDTDGFSSNFSAAANYYFNESGTTYVAWNWRANQGTNVSNTAGSITSTVSASTTAGFSIVTYTGTGANATVGHGLGATPSMVTVKCRSTAGESWHTYHVGLSSLANTVYLNGTAAQGSFPTCFNSMSTLNSTLFSLGTDGASNGSGRTYVAYCFAPIAGYSAFGSYTGNGSSDGPFVFTGFRPRFVLIKESSSAGNNWVIYDTARDTFNECSKILYPNASNAEFDGSTVNLDILSNGFKPRDNWGGNNNSGNTYIYMAFAENPFKYANAR